MAKNVYEERINHLQELLGASKVCLAKDFSCRISCADHEEWYDYGDLDTSQSVTLIEDKEVATPFYRINDRYIVYSGDKVSLVSYKSFAVVDGDNITFIQDDVSYIFKDMDEHIYARKREYGYMNYIRDLDVFVKGNTLYGEIYFNDAHREGQHQIDIDGEYVANSSKDGTFLSFNGNTIYEQKITTLLHEACVGYKFSIKLNPTVLHEDEKEIKDIELIDLSYKNDRNIAKPRFALASIITFADGTKRLLIKNDGKKLVSRYFQDLELEKAYIHETAEDIEKRYRGGIRFEPFVGGYDGEYYSGLTFDCVTDSSQGVFIVKSDGHMKIKSKRPLKNKENLQSLSR